MKWLNLFDENMVFCYGGAMKRLVMIFVLALWLPLGVGLAEESTSIEDEFYNALFNDKGEFIDIDEDFLYGEKGQLYFQLFEERFECVQTAFKSEYAESPSYLLVDRMFDLMTVGFTIYPLQENRYLLFSNCQYRACGGAQGLHIIDIASRDFAFAMITPTDVLKPWATKEGAIGGEDDSHKYSFRLFLSYRISDELKYKFASLASGWVSQYPYLAKKIERLEITPIDCRR